MINVTQFRNDFPEFRDAVTYPDSAVNFWLNFAGQLLNVYRWGASAATPWPSSNPPALTLYDLGTELYVAHNLTLEAQAQEESANGSPPGMSKGPLSSESVDKASASYDTTSASENGGGNWNLTIYGTRFLRLLRQAGAGGMYIGIGFDPQPCLNGPAWPGPYPEPSPTGFSS